MQLTQLKTKEIVQKTFDAIVETLVTERRIELRNFGVFEVKKRAARKARNPRTGERVDVGEKYVVTFKPGKAMEERVRQLEQAEAEGRPLPPRSAQTPSVSFDDDEGTTPDTGAHSTQPAAAQESSDDNRGDRRPGHEPVQSWNSPSYAPGGTE